MHPKLHPVVMFLLMSFLLPFGEVLVLRRVEPYGKAALIEGFLMAAVIYWWYYLDKRERNFRAGAIQNISVAVLSVIALPVYFFRSRGWKEGGIATLLWLLLLVVTGSFAAGGEWLALHITSSRMS